MIGDRRRAVQEEHKQIVKLLGRRFEKPLKYLYNKIYSGTLVVEKLEQTMKNIQELKGNVT